MVVYAPGRTSQYPEIPPERGLRYHYLGGGNEVGNVGIVLEDPSSNRLLLDYGIAQQNLLDIQTKHHMYRMPLLHIPTLITWAWFHGLRQITIPHYTAQNLLQQSLK